MSSKPLSPEEDDRRASAFQRNGGSIRSAAKELGLSRRTFQTWLRKNGYPAKPSNTPPPETDPLPPDLSGPDIWDYATKVSRLKRARSAAETWRTIKIKTSEPFAITWLTDVHLGDNGCDYDALDRDIEATNRTEGAYAAFLGDASNNWPVTGSLAHKWAEQETSRRSEYELVRHFMFGRGIRWLFWLVGNHDRWNAGEMVLKEMNAGFIPMHDWHAKFILECGNKRPVRIDAAHSFKGSSQWNLLHGNMKAAKLSEAADLYIDGHRHEAALHYQEFAERGLWAWLMRARGYKMGDDYALHHGFSEQSTGHAGVTIIDPKSDHPNPIVYASLDVPEGMDFLKFKRRKT